MVSPRLNRPRVEWPTVALGCVIYGAWGVTTYAHHFIPWWGLVPVGGFLIAWHGSLQHEATHGHPTAHDAVNSAFAGIPLSLWLPFGIYRLLHLTHHRTAALTVPGLDPESFYVSQERWAQLGNARRAVSWVAATLLGRLLLGPFIMVHGFFRAELSRLCRGDRSHLRWWVRHAVGLAAVVGWLRFCGFGLLEYLALFVYPGVSLTLLRSFVEHRPAELRAHRSAIVETSPLLGWLFLHNNLHALHHAEPGRPWYEIPSRYRALRGSMLEQNGGYFFPSYVSIVRRYAFRPKDAPIHPGAP